MFNNVALDVIIGLVFIYLLYSLLITILQEIIAHQLSYRAKFLEKAITLMLEDADDSRWSLKINSITKKAKGSFEFLSSFYNHPLVKYLGERPKKSKPSYLHRNSFSKVIVDLLKGNQIQPGDETRTHIQNSLTTGDIKWKLLNSNATTPPPKIQDQTLQFLNSLWVDAQGDVERFKELLENWFDETMERTTGWYKKHIQFVAFFIGLSVAIIFNVDTLAIVEKLEKDPKLREQVVQQADGFIKSHPNLKEELQTEKANVEKAVENDSTIKEKDAVMKEKVVAIEAKYDSLSKRGDSLQKAATDLVKKDLHNINKLLGIGLGSIDWGKTCENKCKILCSVFWGDLLKTLIGWILTALALSLGAPFWFDLLNKLMKLRTSVAPPPSTTGKETKEEGQIAKIKRVG